MIALVLMPFCDIERPSLALGMLKAALTGSGIATDVVYANLQFARHLGIPAASLPQRIWATSLLGEWVFAGAAFPDFHPADERYLDECVVPFARMYADGDPAPLVRALRRELRRLRAAAPAFIDEIAGAVLAGKPAVVGCSSTYAQQVPSLALLRRIRQLAPEVVTLIGGANVEGSMGAAVLRVFPWVDAVCSGEGDEAIVALCQSIISGGRAGLLCPLPDGILTRPAATHGAASRSTVADLDALPIPDYDDYFRELGRFTDSERQLIHPVVPMETSRGCWWRDAHACTFCGLNRGRHAYRTKKPERAAAELEILANRHGIRDFSMADNVMPPGYMTSLLPHLEHSQASCNLFYEIRPGFRRENIRQLAAAGVRHVQAGIESLHDRLLEVMNKGVQSLQNIALLKHAHEFGIRAGWNLLTGLPGDSDEWYREMAGWLPLLHHLQPPSSIHGISLQRFSVYLQEPARYGLTPVPYSSYDVIYPLPTADIHDLAYYFRDAQWPEFFPEVNRNPPGVCSLIAAVEAWRREYGGPRPAELIMQKLDADTLQFTDTRPCSASHEIVLHGLPAQVYCLADDPVDLATVTIRLTERGIHASSVAVREAVAYLVDAHLALQRSDRILALATPAPRRAVGVPVPATDAAEAAFRRYLADIV